jgi:hypothetical protein
MSTLVKNLADVQKYLSNLNSTFRYDFINGALADVQASTIANLFGREFIDALSTRYNAPTPSPALTSQELVLIGHLGSAITHLAFAKDLPTLLVQMGNTGLYQTESQGTKPVYQWQKIEYENALLENAYTPIETAFIYLWANRDHAQFALWKNSAAEKKSLQFVVNTAADFTERFPIAGSRRTYEALKPFIREAELFQIKPIIGDALFDDIKAKIIGFDLGVKYPALIPYLQDAVVQTAIAKSIGRLTTKLDAEGYRVITVQGSGSDSVRNKMTATDSQLDVLKRETMQAAYRYTTLLLNFLNSNLEDYPLFAESDTYKQQQNPPSSNSVDSRVFTF